MKDEKENQIPVVQKKMTQDDYKRLFKKDNQIFWNRYKTKEEYLLDQGFSIDTKIVFFHSKD